MTGMVLAKYACPLPCMDLVSLLHYCMHMIYSVLKIDLICLLLQYFSIVFIWLYYCSQTYCLGLVLF